MRESICLNREWSFLGPTGAVETVDVPHTWNNVDGQDGGNDYWRGTCTYQKRFPLPPFDPDTQAVYLEFQGVNATADVTLNGQSVIHHDGGYLTMTLSVDELDISDIAVGQTASVTADAVEGQTYTGVVTKVSVAGTSTGSATTYPVTIRIDETDGLLPGMSVDATIELDSAENVLAIPTAALNRGNTVLVTADSPSAVNAVTQAPEDMDSSAAPEGGGAAPTEVPEENGAAGQQQYVSVPVTVGISDDNYIEITSGLQEGDVVAYIPTTSSSGGMGMMMGGMPGGMGGGMPGGGGGMPGGGGAPGGM
ncbi:glycosyl hydrolase 2 galactose-binding domain-containing protein [Intestinimonas sp. HCP28S3_D6]|uniref:glycosyl hydrolase 2 galactose-binding domain-containing protein n=1 Tax=Intestinimonas sp. HCP28S3_D6 TaxID=3438942 RepID=UPI003F8C9B87